LRQIAQDQIFTLTCDAVVGTNLVYIGFEVDYGDEPAWADIFFYIRVTFLCWCAFEFPIRIGGASPKEFFTPRNILEMIFVICAALDVILFAKPGWLWRLSGFRSLRMLRIYQYARTSDRLKELSMVLDAMLRSFKPLGFLGLVMAVVYFSAGAWARGILNANNTLDSDDLDESWKEEYWGDSTKAAFTMFQLSTNDGWAGSVVRPILDSDLFSGACLLIYTWATSYTIISLGIGVMVYSTVEEARTGGDHATNMRIADDKAIKKELRKFFEHSLSIQERTTMDFAELRDAWMVPQVKAAFKHFELPMQDPYTLFEHVDKRKDGFITVNQLMYEIDFLTQKATPFDTCCLTARIGGTATFTTRLVQRTDEVASQLEFVGSKLAIGMEALSRAVVENEDLTQVPEVLLRKQGKIKHHREVKMSRYTA